MNLKFDTRDLDLLTKAFRDNPDKFGFYVSKMLNDMAFGTRKEVIDHGIPNTMIVRNKGLLRSHVLVEKSNRNANVNSMFSKTFSKGDKRFTAWVEQEEGGTDKREHVGTLAARGNKKTKPIIRKFRLDYWKTFFHPKQFKGKSRHLRNVIMMQMISRRPAWNKIPFIISGHNTLKPGLYRFEGKRQPGRMGKQKFKLLQAFDRKEFSIKKRPWMSPSVRQYMRKGDWFKPFEKFLVSFGYRKR